jgi:AbrB family looped-hinge helix DNA binding protein
MAKITSGGRVTIPLKIRAALRLRPGDHVEFVGMEDGQFLMAAASRPRNNDRKSPRMSKRSRRG